MDTGGPSLYIRRMLAWTDDSCLHCQLCLGAVVVEVAAKRRAVYVQQLVCHVWSLRRILGDGDRAEADLWLINTCTVKNPSQSAMVTIIQKGRDLGKKLLVTGCVPQGDKDTSELQDLSLLGMVISVGH